MKIRNLIGLVGVFLAGCHLTPYFPSEVLFDSDPGILRGTWTSLNSSNQATETQSFRLEMQAEYVDSSQYRVTGTLTVDETVTWSLQGIVKGNETERYVRTQARLPLTAQLEASLNQLNGGSKTLYCTRLETSTPSRFSCGISTSTSDPLESAFMIERLALK
jgi:hypothetical protein